MKWFDRQEAAIEFCKQRPHHGVFVLHKFNGRRRFCVESYQEFTKVYLAYDIELCHYYEVIRENVPAKLYFDIDIYEKEGVESQGSARVEMFLKYVNHCLFYEYGKTCVRLHALQLDSSTTQKFSQHLIYPEVIFSDNLECGSFVKKIAAAAKTVLMGGDSCEMARSFPIDDLKMLFIKNSKSEMEFIADLAVYTRNRHFRLLRSSKLDRDAHLVVAEDNKFPVISDEQLFMDSLVSARAGSSPGDSLLTCEPPTKKAKKHAENRIPAETSVKSKCKALDEFVLAYLRRHEHHRHSEIEKTLEAKSGRCIAYTLIGSTWCANAKRAHSGNRPYYVANMKVYKLYQMCNAPDCNLVRSEVTDIPNEVIAKFEIGDEELLLQQLIATDDIVNDII